MMERRKKIALELSDLVIYCRPVPFDEDSETPALFTFRLTDVLWKCDAHIMSKPGLLLLTKTIIIDCIDYLKQVTSVKSPYDI